MAFIELGNTKNLFVGHIYYPSDFTNDSKPIYKISTNKYLFIKYEDNNKICYAEYFSKIKFVTLEEEKISCISVKNLKPRIVNLIPFSEFYPDIAGVDDTTLLILLDEINSTRKIGVINERRHIVKVCEEYDLSCNNLSSNDFRDNFIIPYLYKCKAANCKLVLDLDGVYNFEPSFLEEVFGGIVRLGFDKDELLDRIEFICNDEPNLIDNIEEYIKNADKVKLNYKMS